MTGQHNYAWAKLARIVVAQARANDLDCGVCGRPIDYTLSGQPAPTARRGLSVGVVGALILIANLWWRTRTRQREDL